MNKNDVNNIKTGQRLAWIRLHLANGITAKEFAKILTIGENAYNTYEKGNRFFPMRHAYKVKKLYGVNLDFIYDGETGNLSQNIRNELSSNPLVK